AIPPITEAARSAGLSLHMVADPLNSTKQKPQLVIEHLATAIVRVTLQNRLPEFRRGRRLSQGVLREIEVTDHLVIENPAATDAMSRQHDVVRKIPVLFERCAPAVELPLAQKQMGAVVDKILYDDRARIRQRYDQRIFRLGASQATMLDAHAINDLNAFVDAPIGLACLGRDVVADFVVLLARHAIAGHADLLRDACEREKRGLKSRRSEQMIGMVVCDIEA